MTTPVRPRRAWLFVAAILVGATGCLFVDPFNHPPEARIAITSLPPTLIKGAQVTVDAGSSFDPDPGDRGSLSYEWRVDGLRTSNDFAITRDGPTTQLVRFFTAGTHSVSVVATDPRGATSLSASVPVTVADAPPVAEIHPGTAASACQDYVAGTRVRLIARASDADLEYDRDGLRYQWLVQPPSASRALHLGACDEPPGAPGMATYPYPSGTQEADEVCLVPDVHGDYRVRLKVDDGARAGDPPQAERIVKVGPDRPACLDGISPLAGSYLVDRVAPLQLQVTEVLDELDPFPGGSPVFVWSVWRESEPEWRIKPDYNLPHYRVDGAAYGIDELVRVRVEVRDRVDRGRPACDVEDDLCPLRSSVPLCYPNNVTCEAWVTWNLRFR